METALVRIDAVNGGHFIGSDGRLELTIPPGALEPSDILAAGGAVTLRVQQIAPASGGNASASGHYSFGTYLFQTIDAGGNLASRGLRKPISFKLHYSKREQALQLEHAFALFNDLLPNDFNFNPNSGGAPFTAKQAHIGTPSTAPALLSTSSSTLSTTSPLLPTPSSTVSFNTDSADASFGKPDIFNADLSAGALTASYPIDVPAGPGGLKPPVTLAYSSAGVNEQHNPQGAASWVGEGWNMAMGSISWAEHNVAAGCQAFHTCSSPNWQDSWQLSDPYGTTAELIPPNTTVKTYYDDMPGGITPPPVQWHSSAEDHALIWEIQSGLTQIPNPPCFRVFLKNGIMEEFGCTYDLGTGSNGAPNAPPIQYYPRTDGNYAVTQWFLDLITDPKGNQIHINYQQDSSSSLGKSFPRDVVIQSIEWDSPSCRDAQNRCTGASWAPLMQVNFVASHSPRWISGVSCPANGSLRCDDPIDLSGSRGLVNPTVQSTFALNDLQVQIRGAGTSPWNSLRDYQLSFDQSAQHMVIDSLSGKNESVAGKLTLNQLTEIGDDNITALPTRAFAYTSLTNWYTDEAYGPPAAAGCGPNFNSTNCYLWSRSYDGNSYYLTSASNGLGLAQTFGYSWARNNTHGPNNDPLACGSVLTNPCNKADSQNWSRLILTQENGSIVRLTQNGQGGAQTSTPVTSATSYSYLLATFVANPCSDCSYGFYWGNQKDGDFFDYYNSKFMGFAQATVSNPDGGFEVHKFHSTLGWGVYDCAQVALGCAADNGSGATYCYSACHNDPWWPLTGQSIVNALHGHEYEADYFAPGGATPLKQVNTSYSVTCPPAGVSPSPPRNNGNWNGQLVSELDPSNPVAVCDIQTARIDKYTYEGTSVAGAPHLTSTYSYDSWGRVLSVTSVANNGGTGTANTVVNKYDYVRNAAVTATASSATGHYLVDFQAFADTEDGSGKRSGCTYNSYDGQTYATDQSSALTLGEQTRVDRYQDCGTAANGYTVSGQISVTNTYDAYGNQITTNDPEANRGTASHQGCTVSGSASTYSECFAYDSTFDAQLISRSNALNQTTQTNYQTPATSTASGGFGLWPISTTDQNGQTTSYTFDPLGRRTSQTLPNEPSGYTTVSLAYVNNCSGTSAQSPCIEIDHTQALDYTYFRGRVVSRTTITSRAFYDGWGHLVESRAPATGTQDSVRYIYYDESGRLAMQSVAYFVSAATGYSIPDSSRPGAVHTYDALGRLLTTKDPLSNQTSNKMSVACGPIAGDASCYGQTLTVDPLSHQSGGLVDAFGRRQYLQRFTGNSPTSYAVYATTTYTYDPAGNLIQIVHPDYQTSNPTKTTFVYDKAGRKTSTVDPDLGTLNHFYDGDGNPIQSTDPRGSVYAGYDGIDRLLWRSTGGPGTAYTTFSYDDTTSGNVGKGRLTGETFTGGPNNSLSGSYSYLYDARGQETKATLTVGVTAYTVQTWFNAAGSPTLQTYPDGQSVTTGYTNSGWLSSVAVGCQSPCVGTTLLSNATYAENQAGGQFGGPAQQVTGASLGGGLYQYSATFDALLRPTDRKITNSSGSTTLFDQTRTFDAAGNVSTASTTFVQGTDNQVFCYDEQDRLTWAGSVGTPPCTGTPIAAGTLMASRYTDWRRYDNMGRLTARPPTFSDFQQDSYVYGDPAHVHAATSIRGQHAGIYQIAYSAAYDSAGNMTCRDQSGGNCAGSSAGAQLTYDAEGSLVAWQDAPTNPTTTVGFLYDGQGNRVEQQATQNGTTTTTIYVGNLEEASTTGSTMTTSDYYYAGTARIAVGVNGVFTYLGSDGLGSTNVALDSTGNATASTLYKPYGTLRYSSGTMPTSYGFTGERGDGATGLDYFNARYYDPVAGQFTSADTVLPGDGYDAFGLSRYAYVEGNPTTRTDPSGRCPWCIGALVGGVIGGAVSYGTQVAGNLQRGQSLGSALTHVDVGEIGKATLVGMVIGGTGGLATAGLGALGLGGVAAGVGGRVVLGGIEGGGAQIGDNLLHGRSWNDGVGGAMLIGSATGGFSPLGGAALRQVTKRFGREAVADGNQALRGSTCGLSFSADTEVATPGGLRTIASIKAGDKVLAYDPGTKQVTAQIVDEVFLNHDSDRVDVTLEPVAKTTDKQTGAGGASGPTIGTHGTETIHTTANHPWLTVDRGWIDAGALQIGEPIQLATGAVARVDDLQRVPGASAMYDLSLDHVHTFAIGSAAYVVHNCDRATQIAEILKEHLAKARAQLSEIGLTLKQEAAARKNPNLRPAFEGERIDTFAKRSARKDPRLQGVMIARRFEAAPDFYDDSNGIWWDITTTGQWDAHVARYSGIFGRGAPILY